MIQFLERIAAKSASLALLCALAAALCAACGSSGDGEGGDAGSTLADVPDATPLTGTWPSFGVATTWQWQLQGTLNTSYDVDVYDVDLFDTPATTVAAIQGAGRRVLCYFSAGSSEDWRPDFPDFVAADIGKPLDDWEGERWVDIRSPRIRAIMQKRLDLARTKGCDGVEPDNVTAWDAKSGFDITPLDQIDFNRWLADEAHSRGLAIALKNDGAQVPWLVDWFDLSVNEECHFYEECDELEPFTAAGKAILNAEYVSSEQKAKSLATTLCPKAKSAATRTLILPLDLDDSFRVTCD
ncbi:MAG: endo alpha-1,4 polygalactosaminidase [Myxococcota bacterium]